MIDLEFKFDAPLREYSGKGSWHFVTVPKSISDDIKAFTKHKLKGFRTVRVRVKTGQSEWLTSLFPDSKSGTYALPIKAAIRNAETLKEGDMVAVSISVML